MDIKPVRLSERTLGGVDYFVLWAGVAISLAEIWAGGFLAPMGLWMGLWAIILGHIIGNSFMALGGIMGSDHGIMAMVSVRPSFGIMGSRFPAFLNIIQLIGWAAIMLIIAGQAGSLLGKPMGGILASNHFWIVLVGLGTLLWALYTGKSVWRIMQNCAIVVLLLVIIVMTAVSFRELGGTLSTAGTREMSFMAGLDLVIAMPISWLPLVSDYSRFSKRTAPAFWNTWWGYFLISSWMYVLGLVAALLTGSTDPGTLILETMGKAGLAIPALIMVLLSTITSDFPDVYSATCSMMNISSRIASRTLMWITGILSILVALVFPMGQYENFLLFIGAMFMPLFGVILTDYFIIRKRRLQIEDLYKTGGDYWYFRGFNIIAIISWAVGFGIYEFIAFMQYPVGGSIPSIVVAGLAYYIMTLWRRGR
ncbi:MAG: putative hydroxymethylpyrimidine transporter CytX [Deltaproteobacteria bacterium]|nr:putative hydroxymethylpyrimidine transporter CytX [Deltaproteobacteria bacterium]